MYRGYKRYFLYSASSKRGLCEVAVATVAYVMTHSAAEAVGEHPCGFHHSAHVGQHIVKARRTHQSAAFYIRRNRRIFERPDVCPAHFPARRETYHVIGSYNAGKLAGNAHIHGTHLVAAGGERAFYNRGERSRKTVFVYHLPLCIAVVIRRKTALDYECTVYSTLRDHRGKLRGTDIYYRHAFIEHIISEYAG